MAVGGAVEVQRVLQLNSSETAANGKTTHHRECHRANIPVYSEPIGLPQNMSRLSDTLSDTLSPGKRGSSCTAGHDPRL